MAARPKLTASRERRFLRLLELGEPVTACARALNLSTTAIYSKAKRDPVFAERLAAAREHRDAEPVLADWQTIAARLEREYPEHWSLPTRDVGDELGLRAGPAASHLVE
jgi:hypothetical protein